ncbi:hypothetical protein C5167_003722 [Papaver somniferum]|uniref:Uncharacterized protein n=1 Tax=Papaver somniferum TaxID=3469 RepID=A0A4Y7L501_PAPSO|nr:hypothetical protein C5167_003722 [Papaver somniferum]
MIVIAMSGSHLLLTRRLPYGFNYWTLLTCKTYAQSTFSLQVNKQLNDKERVAAALENPGLGQMIDQCLAPTYE